MYNNTFAEHLNTIEKVIQKLKEVSITLKPSKCMFGQTEIELFRQIIEQDIKKHIKQNVEKIMATKRPNTKKGIQSFLGLTGYYRSFIPNYSAIATPLTDLIKKGLPNEVK